MTALLLILSFIFGSVIGSFLNVVILRLPRGQSLGGRSGCPRCGRGLLPWELVPLLSFLFLRGKCSSCGKKISPRYFFIEFVTGLLFVLICLYAPPVNIFSSLLLLKLWLAAAVLVVVFVIDLEHYLILDRVIFPGSVLMLLINVFLTAASGRHLLSLAGFFVSGLAGAMSVTVPFFLLWYFSRGTWLGFGDVKLAVFLGLVLGWPQSLVGLMLAVFLGGTVSLLLLCFSGKNLKSQVPFGTFLSLGALLAVFYGPQLLRWYLAILGI